MYERERKKIKAKAIDSNTTALDDKKAEEEVKSRCLALHFYKARGHDHLQHQRALRVPLRVMLSTHGGLGRIP